MVFFIKERRLDLGDLEPGRIPQLSLPSLFRVSLTPCGGRCTNKVEMKLLNSGLKRCL